MRPKMTPFDGAIHTRHLNLERRSGTSPLRRFSLISSFSDIAFEAQLWAAPMAHCQGRCGAAGFRGDAKLTGQQGAAAPLHVVVAALTRGRIALFSDLLDSLAQMDLPEGVTVSFCFVENAAALQIGGMVDQFARRRGCSAVALLQPQLGIPFARNKALQHALDQGASHLAFVDDDEQVTQGWLVRLLERHVSTGADLTGGPEFPMPPEGSLTLWQRVCYRGLAARSRRMAWHNRRLERWGAARRRPTVITNNWLVRLDFVRETDLRFDERLGFSGGSDVAFFRALRGKGGQTSWAADAIVHEVLPRDRLSLRYQFRRGRDQSIASYRVRYGGDLHGALFLRSVFFVGAKLLLGCVRLMLSVLDGGRSLVLAVRAFGFAYGCILAMFGRVSEHYS